MNNGRVKSAEAKSLYPFTADKSKRVMTVNYFNLMVRLPKEESCLLNFLIKESTNYNTFKYSTRLLEKYKAYVKVVGRVFPSGDKKINTNVKYSRDVFIRLIEKGLVFRGGKEYVINFALTYSPQYTKEAIDWIKQYSGIVDKKLGNGYLFLINNNILQEIRK